MNTKNPIKNPIKIPTFCCILCNLTTDNKKDYARHTATSKHIKRCNTSTLNTLNTINIPLLFTCKCGKKYKYSQGLSNHKKKCIQPNIIPLDNITISLEESHEPVLDNEIDQEQTIYNGDLVQESDIRNEGISVNHNQASDNGNMHEILMMLIQSNTEFKQLILEQQAKIMELAKSNNSNNTNSNNTNITNTVNITLPVFLNDCCKNATTMNTFESLIQPNEEQILYTTIHGAEDGIYNIIDNTLKTMDITERPFHCTDIKRQIMHVNIDNVWVVDTDQIQIKKMYSNTVTKSSKMAVAFINENPEYRTGEKREYFNPMMSENMGGTPKRRDHNESNIIGRLCKKTHIDKYIMNQTAKAQIQESTL